MKLNMLRQAEQPVVWNPNQGRKLRHVDQRAHTVRAVEIMGAKSQNLGKEEEGSIAHWTLCIQEERERRQEKKSE